MTSSRTLGKEGITAHRLIPGPWTEVVGIVEEVLEDSLILSLKKEYVIHVRDDELKRWKHVLRKGSRVGILFLDDGGVRVRSLDGGEAGGSEDA